jgi:hypothetical protein
MNHKAVMPKYPNPPSMTSFRGVPLTHHIAEEIFIGHLQQRSITLINGELDSNQLLKKKSKTVISDEEGGSFQGNALWSWKVVCGQNPAYDYFGCQHQIFYREFKPSENDNEESASQLWYDPVFKVNT